MDRDGVINRLLPNDYIKQISEFELLEDTIPALSLFKKLFARIFIVTNQQGIGKGLMINSIDEIHTFFLSKLPPSLHPDKIYHCPHLTSDNCVCRKPKPGMALMAKNDFPDIELTSSIIVGDSLSDMEFGQNAGMNTAFISSLENETHQSFENLLSFANFLTPK